MSEQQPTQVALDFQIPADLPASYATQLLVQAIPGMLIIQFFEVRNPILIGTPEQVKATAASIKKLPAVCVSRVAVPVAEFPNMLKALQEVWTSMQAQTRPTGTYAVGSYL